ncbi:MAG TPA: ATP-dependent zinc metalloprotease FtsH [Bryobacteraceae bacterium]|nr:ATP-dependent zinc metalloprotease FtsH [Bryobacteraceae bacterium]
MDPERKNRLIFSAVNFAVLIIAIYLATRLIPGQQSKTVSYSEFMAELRADHLSEVQISEHELIGVLKTDAAHAKNPAEPATITAARLPGVDESELLKELEAHPVKFQGRIDQMSWIWNLMGWILPFLFILLIFRMGMQRMGQAGGTLTFGKNRAKIHDESSKSKVTFEDVAGLDEAKLELEEVVDFLRLPAKYQKLGGRIPKGVLLVGPPGTGKTLLAKAVAGEARVAFFSLSGSEFVEMFVGVGAARVRDLFEQAKLRAPCIVFIDELDAIGKSRTSGRAVGFSNDEREQTLNQLLAEMDGFDSSEGVILMAATNTPEVLDAALLRAGRFDRQVVVDRPDLKDRVEILKVHARKIHMAEKVDLETIAARTPGMVGADLANIVNEAALLAVRRGGERVEIGDLELAVDRVMLGLEKKSRVMSPEEKERVAVHESGHALVALSVQHADPVHRVSIIPRSIGALGYTLQLPTQERYLMTKPELEDQIAVLLGGRAAEEIHYGGVVSTGAADDLERASELVRQMVTRFGMNDQLGKLTYGKPMSGPFLKSPFEIEERNYSEKSAEMIDVESRRIIDQIYATVKQILEQRLAAMDRISRELVRKETLERAELDRLLAGVESNIGARELVAGVIA